ncbi:MAG: hypothetical protein CENE_01283 [Candidatus Celerinatantimonas neptuna]|nr:MAG: hypothetical protein CENE_01283 [Candidatus Celerinatantimonas neptuna]
MQIQAYQQHQASSLEHNTKSSNSQATEHSSPESIKTQLQHKQASQIGPLLARLRDNKSVQHYVKSMLAAIDSGNFNTQKFAHKAPPAMQQAAHRLGINLPEQLAIFGKQLQKAGQPLPHFQTKISHFGQPHQTTTLLHHLTNVNETA